MAEYTRDVPRQKIKAGEKHICPECFHYRVCMVRVNRPCFECDCFVPAADVKYDTDEFFSAERYPLPITCGECGHTMRPVHKHYVPDMPRTYFCTFCGAGFHEDNPAIRFRKRQTNADRIRQMSDEELVEWAVKVCCIDSPFGCPAFDPAIGEDTSCRKLWLDWLQQEVES